jgi:hypothetical protein
MPAFEREWARLELGDDLRRSLEQALIQNPLAGVLLQETGGIRKVRHALPGRGKSGSIRVFYYDYPEIEHLFLLAVIKKTETENLTKAQRQALRLMIESTIASYETKTRRRK